MELTKQELKAQLKEAVNAGYLIPFEADNARKAYKKSGDQSILELIEERKVARQKEKSINTKQWHDLSELEALQKIVKQNSVIVNQTKSINGWVTFIGIITLIGVVGTIIAVAQIS